MSFWGATVITSLVTTIPIVGKQIVFWLWGGQKKAGYYRNIIKDILLSAGTSFHFLKVILCYLFMSLNNGLFNVLKTIRLQNEVKMLTYNSFIRRFINQCTFYNKYTTVPVEVNEFQRLNAEDLQWFVGFFEGDGSFSVNKNGKYLKYEMSIEVSIRDVQLLHKIKKILGNYGSISTRIRKGNIESARLKIASKPILVKMILPIFDKYPMFTSKQNDYLFFRECLMKNVVYAADLPVYNRPNKVYYTNILEMLKTSHYDNWLVGFIEAEGCFSTYFVERDQTMKASFSIVQKDGLQVLEAIKYRLKITSNPYFNKETKAYSLNTSSVRGVQNVINFLKYTKVRLLGHKKAQYLKWLHNLRIIDRYKTLNIPSIY